MHARVATRIVSSTSGPDAKWIDYCPTVHACSYAQCFESALNFFECLTGDRSTLVALFWQHPFQSRRIQTPPFPSHPVRDIPGVALSPTDFWCTVRWCSSLSTSVQLPWSSSPLKGPMITRPSPPCEQAERPESAKGRRAALTRPLPWHAPWGCSAGP